MLVSSKIKRLAAHLYAFREQVKHDLQFKTNIYAQYDEQRKAEALIRFEHEAWLFCRPANEMQAKQRVRRQLQNPDLSKVNGRLNHEVFSIFDKWSKETLLQRKSIKEEHFYAFYPDEKSSVLMLLAKLKDAINHPKNTIALRAAKLCRTYIVEYLFAEMDKKLLSDRMIKSFLSKYQLSLENEAPDQTEQENTEPIKNKPGRRSVSSEKIVQYIKHLIKWFLLDPVKFHTVGETILVIWCELAVSYFGRRACPITDILAIKEKDIHPPHKLGYYITINKRSVPISKSLCDMLLCISSQQGKDPNIFSIDRSTIENHLESVSRELNYDLELFPITPETFLERPIECGLDCE